MLCQVACPFEAMRVETNIEGDSYTPIVNSDFCSQCGFCVSACEFDAVSMGDWKRSTFGGYFAGLLAENAKGKRPTILAFICERSLNQGGFLNEAGNRVDGEEEVAVMMIPCVGMMSPTILDDALAAGAKGALVIGCRGFDCHYREKRRRIKFTSESKMYNRFIIENIDNPRIGVMETSPFDQDDLRQEIARFAEYTKTVN